MEYFREILGAKNDQECRNKPRALWFDIADPLSDRKPVKISNPPISEHIIHDNDLTLHPLWAQIGAKLLVGQYVEKVPRRKLFDFLTQPWKNRIIKTKQNISEDGHHWA